MSAEHAHDKNKGGRITLDDAAQAFAKLDAQELPPAERRRQIEEFVKRIGEPRERGEEDAEEGVTVAALANKVRSILKTPAAYSVARERIRQDEKWGEQDHSPEWWLAILTEEVGELAQGILHDRFGTAPRISQIRKEAVRVAAVALATIEYIDRMDDGAIPADEVDERTDSALFRADKQTANCELLDACERFLNARRYEHLETRLSDDELLAVEAMRAAIAKAKEGI